MIKKISILLSKITRVFSIFSSEYILVCKLDSIGDYILFRNFLLPFKKTSFVQNKKILLVANSSWKSIYEKYDNEFAEKVIWVNVERIIKNRAYRLLILLKLNCFKIHTVVQPTFSRDSIVDFLLLSLSSKRKISQKGDDLNYLTEFKLAADQKYDTLINEASRNQFEFDRNRNFFSQLDKSLSNIQLDLPFKKSVVEKKYISFFIGASATFRQLSLDNLLFIIKQLLDFTDFEIIILGGKRELEHGEILSGISPRVVSQCGRTTLVDTIDLIGNSKAVLTMDSSGLHMAMASKVAKVFCFSNGNHIFRFVPYPESYKQLKVFFPPLIQKNLSSEKETLYQSFSRGSVIPINTIDFKSHVEEIINELNAI
ncbi:glycosyltransferase family 9 protein [Leptospira perdikensis]|uniref:Lipopolysaccharide heptosyltransferase family protein n=1 Tax=Leptospira perdikensis TaxID=2484948 RepID=A0A4R9JC64_9LEPT|nr:lipopolysaccharide heptosyltransferase family protein [Leptospira perdikensis]TGL37123.1 lipopolysaccharide heptosyltransferase family protein [Leptospira perdikensis]